LRRVMNSLTRQPVGDGASRFVVVVGLACAAICRAQIPPQPEIALAVKSPTSLARYIESHPVVEWSAIRRALDLGESEHWLAPCGPKSPYGNRCSTETVTAKKPEQAILIVGSASSYALEYLRYIEEPSGDWRFSGELNVLQRNGPSHHQLTSHWNRPFLAISSDHSQHGVAIRQVVEDWFDLTKPDFKPMFSFTTDGSEYRWSYGVGRTMHETCKVRRTAQAEVIDLALDIHFDGVGLDQKATYVGIFERREKERTFKLRSAYAGLDRSKPIPTEEFADLADPFSGIDNEELLGLALPGLEKIARGTDADAKEWLKSILNDAKDTPEKRRLLDLLVKP
jgi:hypothetical protein